MKRQLLISLALFTTAIVVACEDATLVEPQSAVEPLVPTVDIDATVQAAISATTLTTDSLNTAVAVAISETAAALPTPAVTATSTETSVPTTPTPTPNPTPDVRPVVLPQETVSPTAVPAPTTIPTPTEIPSPTVVPPSATPIPPPPTALPSATPTQTATPIPTASPTATPAPLSLDQLVEVFAAAVVRISSPTGVGSGVIFRLVGTEAFVLTNQHVVGSSNSVTVLVDDTSEFSGRVVSTDISRDLAVVRICCSADFLAIEFANPDDVKLGKSVVVLGYPLGFNSLRVSQGIVSGLEAEPANSRDVIQTDAAINPGNSGGPLLLMTGRIAGINTYKVIATNSGVPTEGLGFAVSVSTIVEVIDVMASGSVVAAATPVPHPETVDGKYVSPQYGYEVQVPSGWSLDTSVPWAVTLWDEFSGATISIQRSTDFPGYVDIEHWRQEWTYLGLEWQENVINNGESTIFRSYAGNPGSSDMLRGLEFRNTYEIDGELFQDFTHLFYENGILWFVSIYVPNLIWILPEYSEYRLAVQAASSSFRPPFTQ